MGSSSRLPDVARVKLALATVFLLVGALAPTPASATGPQSGNLDPSFGASGVVLTAVNRGGAYAIAIQGSGKIITAGFETQGSSRDFALVEYAADGTLNSDFGQGGKVVTGFGGPFRFATALGLAIQRNQKIVAVGGAYANGTEHFGLARYNPDGSLDPSFGTGGTVVTDFSGTGSTDEARAVAIQSDGKIVAAGVSDEAGSYDFALARYNPDGSLDASFGVGGKVVTDLTGTESNDFIFKVAILPNGKLLAVGGSTSAGPYDFAAARYNPDGSLDSTFGAGGVVLTPFEGSAFATGLGVQADGRIVAGGWAEDAGTSRDFALARYMPDGSLDTSFGTGGRVHTDFTGAGSFDEANDLVIQRDGRIVAVGEVSANAQVDFALARYNSDGSLDTSFGVGGKVMTGLRGPGSFDIAYATALQSNGRIVAAGADYPIGFALARYVP